MSAEEALNRVFNQVDKGESYAFLDYEQIFKFNVDQTDNIEKTLNYKVTSKKFRVHKDTQ